MPRSARKLLSLGVGVLGAVGIVVGVVVARPKGEVTADGPERPAGPVRLVPRVHRTYPHDRTAFTQGLIYRGGKLYESCGLRGQSSIRRVDLATGRIERVEQLDPSFFGEGLASAGSQLIQLTWQGGQALVWERDSFSNAGTFRYQGEGWGLCFDGTRFIMSDGSSWLTFRDRQHFEALGRVQVRLRGQPVRALNELECVQGQVYANVWQTDRIVRIRPADGVVTAVIDGSTLLSEAERADINLREDVLNGIAWIPSSGRFLLTGKRWPKVFEVDFVPVSRP